MKDLSQEPVRIALLGATGMAGRAALEHHDWLTQQGKQYGELTYLAASSESAGHPLGEVFDRKQLALHHAYPQWPIETISDELRSMPLQEIDVDRIARRADVAISALDSDIAKTVEPALAAKGVIVFSNSSAYRWGHEVPLLIPEVNPQALDLLDRQQSPGKIICNPNCTASGFVPVLDALRENHYPLTRVVVHTQQALSGKGDTITTPEYLARFNPTSGNAYDDWTTSDGRNEEEWKSRAEPLKILGYVHTREEAEHFQFNRANARRGQRLHIIADTARQPTPYGHLERLTVDFDADVNVAQIKERLRTYHITPEVRSLPTTPSHLFTVIDGMPQAARDVMEGDGMSIVVGDIQQQTVNTITMSVLVHNTRRGATWCGRQGLELYLQEHHGREFITQQAH